MRLNYDLVVIGGGPAGLAAALEANKNGVEKILVLERDKYLGGILQQCIHNGFGLDYFKEELTGPEYAHRFIKQLSNVKVDVKIETMVVSINQSKEITAVNSTDGVMIINARAIILAMGCRERTREAIRIPGGRPAGVLTAGTAQRYVNIEGYMPGKEIVILGSGDIGLIMARRMTLEGANVKAVLEIRPYSTGLIRNKVQCLDDYQIPLLLNHTITKINGNKRVESVFISKVDKNMEQIPGSEKEIFCDTILFSVGLIPENELTKEIQVNLDEVTGGPIVNEIRETEIDGVFACGNVLQVHDLVDYVTEESEIAGRYTAKYLQGGLEKRNRVIVIIPDENISYVVPQRITYFDHERKLLKLFMRVRKPEENVRVKIVDQHDNLIAAYKRPIVSPGEMLTVSLPEKLLKNNLTKLRIFTEKEGR